MEFEFFDPASEFSVHEGNLPHWYQPGVTYFVTFRTEDSVPDDLSRAWHGERDAWLRRAGIDPRSATWKSAVRARPELEREFHETFTSQFMNYLDRGFGVCALRRPDLANCVADSLMHFDGQRYHLGDYIVMPNHVHLLVRLLGTAEIESQCKSWKKYTAVQINRALEQRGRFWQEESFDHLVRSPEQLAALQVYIADNPMKARLQAGEYLHYVRRL